MLSLHHDYPSAGSLRAVLVMEELAGQGHDVNFLGIDVMGLAAAIPATLDDIRAWDMHRMALRRAGWELRRPRRHPPTLDAHLVESLAESAGKGGAWRLACYRAHWVTHSDISDREVLVALAGDVGLDDEAVHRLLDDPAASVTARRRMLAARGSGVGGVPVLEVNGTKVSPFLDLDELRLLASL